MTKVIIISGSSLDSFYEQQLQYLHDKYHNYPTSLSGNPVPKAEAARQSYYDTTARHASKGLNISGDIQIGKTVF
jgi:hypothetical protein